jgi:hypothetical protein
MIHKLIISIFNKEELMISGRSLLLNQFTKRGDNTVAIMVGYHCFQLHTKCCPITFSQGKVHT